MSMNTNPTPLTPEELARAYEEAQNVVRVALAALGALRGRAPRCGFAEASLDRVRASLSSTVAVLCDEAVRAETGAYHGPF